MSIIGWNCRGLGNLSVIPKLKYLVHYYKPDVLFLSETLVHSNKTNDFRYMLGFDNCFAVSSNGRSGGLTLFWQNSFNCTVLITLIIIYMWRSTILGVDIGNLQVFMVFQKVGEDVILGIFCEVYLITFLYLGVY